MIEKLKTIIATFVDIDPDSITEKTDIKVDLGMNSLDLINVACAIENEYGITVNNKEIVSCNTVEKLVNYIKKSVET